MASSGTSNAPNTNTPDITTTIVECYRCQDPQVFRNAPGWMDSDIPVALDISLDGGYAMFVDNTYCAGEENPLQFTLCHKCAHEFTQFMGIPNPTVTNWHPKTEDTYCNGWTFVESLRKELALFKEELSDLIYMNEDTMIVPFDDYPQKKAQLEELIKLQEERLAEYEQKG